MSLPPDAKLSLGVSFVFLGNILCNSEGGIEKKKRLKNAHNMALVAHISTTDVLTQYQQVVHDLSKILI